METMLEPLTRLRDLYNQGQYLQAFRSGEAALGPLRDWPAPAGRVLAGRMANNLGARRLGRLLFLRAYREFPHDPEVRYFCVWCHVERRGPLAAWEFLQRVGEMPEAPHKTRADWYALHGRVLAMLRDFEAAEHWLERARLIAEDRPWIWVEYAHLLEREDRYEESLAAAKQALTLQPWYRPAVQAVAHELTLLARHDEARDLLAEAATHVESGDVLVQLAMLEAEQDRHRQAADHFEQAMQYFPLLEKDYRRWLCARRCDAEYRLGNDAAAVELARQASGPFYDRLAEKLDTHVEGRRVTLPVGFVRQHHVTCAPATLSAISRYWSMPAEHVEVAQRICYDGTPAHSERGWAEDNGWVAREFTVTWDSVTALVDRGLPFTLTTVAPGASHLQAAIGYDSRLGTVVVRDPTEPFASEMLVDSLLELCRSSGPRGMVLVPREHAARLDGLDLPDAGLYDLYYSLHRALELHDRAKAQALVEELAAADAEHRLTLSARLVLARYDNDPASTLTGVGRLLEKYPEDLNLQLLKLWALRELARRDERLTLLETLYANGRRDPLVCQNLARELRDDAREFPRAIRLLRTAIRANPTDAETFYTLASMHWDRLEWNRATELYRFAACLADKDESLAKSYFMATRHLKRVDEALRFLRERFRRYGSRSSWPARTLCWAYEELNRVNEAFDTVAEALKLRPDDATLLLYGADLAARHNRPQQADEMLARAQSRSHAQSWRRAAANIALYRGDHAQAMAHWQAVAETEPWAADAHRTLASLLADSGDRAGAVAHLRGVIERFPHNYPLQQLLIEWLRPSDPEETAAAVRQLLEIHPVDAWGHRELALTLSRLSRHEEALAEANLAAELDPNNPATFAARGLVASRMGHLTEAKEDYRRAIRLSVDNEASIDGLMSACDNEAQRRESLEFIADELKRQVIFGEGLTSFRQYAHNTLAPDELLAVLNEACQVRPDLWNAWSALVWQFIDMKRLDEGLRTAEEACERFPLMPRIWLDLAGVHRAREDHEGEVQALRQALEINPTWGPPARRLAEIHDASGDLPQARTVLEQAVAWDPGDAINLGCLADVLWRMDDKEPAIERLRQALRLDPGYDWGWDSLPRWLAELDRQSEVLELAREIAAARPGEARSWLAVARIADGEANEEALSALERAIALNPCLGDAYDLKAERLAQAGRFDEALAACHPAAWPERPPVQLRARAADVEYARGNAAEAIAQLKAVVAEEPEYPWAWHRLATWYHDDNKATDDYLHAAQRLHALSPQNPAAWGHLGAARLRTQDRAGAKDAYRQALEISPDYSYAGLWLADLHLEDNELDVAEQVLANLKKHDAEGFVVARQIDAACRRQDREGALARLCELCGTTLDEPWPFTSSIEALSKAGWQRDARRLLREAMDNPESNPQVGPAWLSLCSLWSRPSTELARMPLKEEAWLRASMSHMEALVAKKRFRAVRKFARRQQQEMRGDDRAWGTIAWALMQAERYGEVVEWTSDWRLHLQATAYTLFCRATSLWYEDRVVEALEVSRAAIELRPDETTPLHQLWLAAGELLSRQPDAAAEQLGHVDRSGLSEYYRALAAMLMAASTEPGAGNASYRRVRGDLRTALAPYWSFASQDAVLKRLYHRILKGVADARGNRLAALAHRVRAL